MIEKFDIRQWILITSWNPLVIWFYDKNYLRFNAENYSLDDINNKYIHLTNNCIIKNHKEFNKSKIPGNMWTCQEFREYLEVTLLLQKKEGHDVYGEKIKPAMQKIVIDCIKSCNEQLDERINTAELLGYDFMVDPHYNVWLIEINKSPSMDTNTVSLWFRKSPRSWSANCKKILWKWWWTMASIKQCRRNPWTPAIFVVSTASDFFYF